MNKVKESAKVTSAKNEGTKKVKTLSDSQKLAQLKKVEAQQKAIEFLGTKIVNGKEITPSKKTVKAQTTIEMYLDKENRSLFETKLLINALSKTDNLSPSKVYKKMVENDALNGYFCELSGMKNLPTFKQFLDKLPIKFAYSEWDILGALSKLNPKHKLNAKIERQNKATQAK